MRAMLLALCLVLTPGIAQAQGVTVFAASSLTDALTDIGTAWQKAGHKAVRFSFSASSTLARQIAEGAPAALFASADERWMDYLAKRHLLVPGTRHDVLTNRLVLVVPAKAPGNITLGPGFDLAALLGPDGRLAVGDPSHVPAGIYAEQALKSLGVWDTVRGHLAPTADVRGALLLVERGEVPAAVVYATDAAIAPGVKIAGVFPASSHDPIVYPFALVRSGDTAEARAFMAFLGMPPAQAIFRARGFGVRGDDPHAHG